MYPDFNPYNQNYGMPEYNYRSADQLQAVIQPSMQSTMQASNSEIITLNQAIGLIRQSIGNEREDEMFYETLIRQAPTEKEKNIIRSIRDDERRHNQILRRLYYEFTGQMAPPDQTMEEPSNNGDYKANLEKALFGELEAVVKYRKILGTMPSGTPYTLIMSIMTDELRHASKYNFLIHNAK